MCIENRHFSGMTEDDQDEQGQVFHFAWKLTEGSGTGCWLLCKMKDLIII